MVHAKLKTRHQPLPMTLCTCCLSRVEHYNNYLNTKYVFVHRALNIPSIIDTGHIDLYTHVFMLKALGWCIPGISDVGRFNLLAERSSFSSIFRSTCSSFGTICPAYLSFLAQPDLFLL